MRRYIYDRIMVLLRKRRYQGMTYNNIAFILNKNKYPCWFAPDYIWTGIHVLLFINNKEEMFDAEQYNEETKAIVLYNLKEGLSMTYINRLNTTTGLPLSQPDVDNILDSIYNETKKFSIEKSNQIAYIKNIIGSNKKYKKPILNSLTYSIYDQIQV